MSCCRGLGVHPMPPIGAYAAVLKWATLPLFACVAVVFAAHVSWRLALHPRCPSRFRRSSCQGHGRGPWHHNQPIPVVLASWAGSCRRTNGARQADELTPSAIGLPEHIDEQRNG